MSSRLFLLLLVLVAPGLRAQNTVTIDGSFGDWLDEAFNVDADMGAPVCDDVPAQGDVKAAGIASDFVAPGPATTIFLRFDFDETATSGAGQSLDGCWLLDVSGSGTVTQALCFTLQGNPVTITDTRYFTCNGSTIDTCAGATMQTLPASAACLSAVISAPDILHDCTGTNPMDTSDAGVECSIALSDIGWTSGPVTLLQACSYNSQQPNSNGVDCTIDADNPWIIDPETGDTSTPTVPVELITFTVD